MDEISVSTKELFSAGVGNEAKSLMDICRAFFFSALQNIVVIQRVNLSLFKQAKVLLITP
jgi:hypothetical protein